MNEKLKKSGWIVVIGCTLAFSSCQMKTAQQEKALAHTILSDSSLCKVDRMGRQLFSKGFDAGSGYVSQVWARDLNTFIEIACDEVDHQQIKEAIRIFFCLQQPNQEMIDGYVLKGEFNWGDPNPYYADAAPKYVGFKNTVETDQETSLIQLVGKYVEKTGDRSILSEVVAGTDIYTRMEWMIEYLMRNKMSPEYGLLTGALTADWGDVQANNDELVDITEDSQITIDVYDNAMFVIALDYMAHMTDNADKKAVWNDLKNEIAKKTRQVLWDTKRHKFIPHIYLENTPNSLGFDENEIYYHGGTTIAIEAGLLNREEVKEANQKMLENVIASGMPTIGLTLYPPYPVNFFRGGMSQPYIYQNGGDWTWFGGRMIQQLILHGFVEEAYEEMKPMIERVIANGGFYEWYGMGNVPSGSGSFKGSAGVLCKAIELMRNWAEEHK